MFTVVFHGFNRCRPLRGWYCRRLTVADLGLLCPPEWLLCGRPTAHQTVAATSSFEEVALMLTSSLLTSTLPEDSRMYDVEKYYFPII